MRCDAKSLQNCDQFDLSKSSCICTRCKVASSFEVGVQVYYLTTDNTCLECMPLCASCTSNSECKECKQAYFKNSTTKQCARCPWSNCSACEQIASGTVCKQCNSGYVLHSFLQSDNTTKFVCIPCQKSCSTCVNVTREICLECKQGHYMLNHTCIPERANCANSSTNGSCLICELGFRLVDGWCIPCYSIIDKGHYELNLGYINCEYGDSGIYYVRDGDTLT